MLPTAIVEQQAELGVSAEDSKAQRLKRLQARFRDRGGVFVPSDSNPLVDILLARTVSGESPSKARPKDVAARRSSSSKARQALPKHKTGATTITEGSQAVTGGSKSKPPAPRKRNAKIVEPEVMLPADTAIRPAPKRRSKPAKSKKKAPDSDTEQPPLDTNTKSKSASNGNGKRRNAVPSTSDGNPKVKTNPQTKAKSNRPREVVEVLVSDDDQTLVDIPHKAKSNPKMNIRYEDDDETDDDIPIVRKRAIPPVDKSKASNSKTTTRVATEKIASKKRFGKKTLEDGEEKPQGGKYPKTNVKKRLVLRDDDEDTHDITPPPPGKKGKVASSTSAKFPNVTESTPRTTKDIKPNATGKGKGKGGDDPDQGIIKLAKEDDDERPPERVSKLKKRKKEEDNYDDRPRKVVKFSETGPSHSSSQKLKENQSDKKDRSAAKPSVKDEHNAPHPKLAAEPLSRMKISKGPPREVLERIKASAVRHLRFADSEPDELDCLS